MGVGKWCGKLHKGKTQNPLPLITIDTYFIVTYNCCTDHCNNNCYWPLLALTTIVSSNRGKWYHKQLKLLDREFISHPPL